MPLPVLKKEKGENVKTQDDIDDIVLHLKIMFSTAIISVVLIIALAIYESDTTISQPQAQVITENTRDAFFVKNEK